MEINDTFLFLCLIAYLTSVLSGVIGLGGGMMLMAVMTLFFPPTVLIPLHGVVQLASNGSRAALSYKSVSRRITVHFALGACLGALLVSQVIVQIPEQLYQLLIGTFIVFVTWVKPPRALPQIPFKFFWIGSIATFISTLVGAVGPFIAPFYLREGLTKEGLVATKAASQVFQHAFKLLIFGVMGFAFRDYALLLFSMVLCAALGSWTGKSLLGKLNEQFFERLFKWGITILALRMIVLAVRGAF